MNRESRYVTALLLAVALTSFWVNSNNPSQINYRTIAQASALDTPQAIMLLEERREQIRNWISLCADDSDAPGQTSNSANACVQGDIVLWAGMSCLAAHLSNDQLTMERCQDVTTAQGANGRWWRGISRIDVQKENSFSRDMALGVASYMLAEGIISKDEIKKSRIKTELQNWWEYIEKEHNGKKMCDDATDSRCRYGNGHALYIIGKEIGAITESNKNYNVIKKHKKPTPFWKWKIDFMTMIKPSYRVHLKAQDLLVDYLLKISNEKDYLKKAALIYKKDRANPFYDFLYLGTSDKLIHDLLNKCPVEKPKNSVAHPYRWSASWWFMSDSKERAWEIASGHECIFLMNLMLAQLNGKLSLPNINSNTVNADIAKKENVNICQKKNNYLGSYQNLDICRVRPHFALSEFKCKNENGIIWEHNPTTSYCLLNKKDHWKAREIKRSCPLFMGKELDETIVDLPVCAKSGSLKKISLPNCNKKLLSVVKKDEAGTPKFCYINHGNFYEKKEISRICPMLHSNFMNEYINESWPVCKSRKKIQPDKCDKDYAHKRADHCLFIEKGWYSYNEFKSICPKGKIHTGLYKDEKPLCKARVSLKISKKKCSKKGGVQYENHCLWDEGTFWKVSKLK